MNLTVDQILNQAISAHQEGKLEEAEKKYKEIINLQPNHAVAHVNLGTLLQRLGKFEEAGVSFKKAIKIRPDFAEAHFNLGNMLNILGKLNESEESYKKAIKFKTNFVEAYCTLATTMEELGRTDEALANYDKAIEIKSNLKSALLDRGKILHGKGEFELALKDLDNCNNNKSRAQALSSLYALGRVEEIYQRIEKNSELDDTNLRVAAFASFIAAKEGRETAHNFCKNPLDFIHHSNISSHVVKSELFTNEVIKELHDTKVTWEPKGKSTFKGFQSTSNLFKNPSTKINDLKSIIIDEVNAYHLKFKDKDCSFIKKWPSKINLRAWHVILKKQGYQISHIHPGAWLSGVIYLKVVPSFEKNEGAIEFSLNGKNYSDPSSPKLIHQPKVGDIVLFPSTLHHRTIPFTADEDRIIISFDLRIDVK